MTFAKIERTFKRTSGKYLKIVSGVPCVILILDEHPTTIGKHWITDGAGRRVGLTCIGKSVCPICIRNQQIGYNKEHPDYIPFQSRYRINVLELTPVKKCPKCDTAYPQAAALCNLDGCNTALSDVEIVPLNEVKILERGPQLMERLNALEAMPHFSTGTPLPLQSYPILLVATGSGRQMDINPVPQAPIDVDTSIYEKFDLTAGVILTPEEITYLLEGGVYRDILAAREADTKTEATDVATTSAGDIPF